MNYSMTTPCDECPFLKKMAHGFTAERLGEFSTGEFPCHKSAEIDEESGDYKEKKESVHCAGALIFNEKRNQPHQMMRIAERLGMYDYTKLNIKSKVR